MRCAGCGSEWVIKNGSGRYKCKDCGSTRVQGHFPAPADHTVKGVSTLYDSDGNVKAQWVKSNTDHAQQRAALEEIALAAISKLPKLKRRPAVGKTLHHLAVGYPVGDAHVGMLSWPKETGETWDIATAEAVQCSAVKALTEAAPKAESAVLVTLGDLLHYDQQLPMTTRSRHVLDADSRYAKMAGAGVKILRQCIESALARHDRLRVVVVQGNHDEIGSLWLSMLMAHLYENDDRVTVDDSPAPFRYFRHGKTLVGCHHGHQCKPDRLPGVMAADMAVDWGQTLHRYWWLGHVHHQSVKEHPGCFVESFNTLAARDAYATAGGWRSARNMKAIVLHDEWGEVARHTVDARMFQG